MCGLRWSRAIGVILVGCIGILGKSCQKVEAKRGAVRAGRGGVINNRTGKVLWVGKGASLLSELGRNALNVPPLSVTSDRIWCEEGWRG
jgi:hypothetical protein